jgi:hypothetical protein
MFRDVVKGFTRKETETYGIVYIKHLTTHDQVDLEEIEDTFFEKAQSKGLSTEKERLDSLIKEGGWTKEDSKFLESQKAFIGNLNKAKFDLILKSQIDAQQKIIESELKKLNEKLFEKESLIGNTCEKYSKQRVNDYYISRSFFKDDTCLDPLFTEKQYEELTYSEVGFFVKTHNSQFSLFEEENIQRMILEDFYFPYMPFCEDTIQFFGKPVCALTHNQLKLILFTRVFKNIFDNNENIPDKIRKDPQALMDFASSSRKGKEVMDKHAEKGGHSTIVGATKEDYEYMGVSANESKGTQTLHQAAEKKGGSLNMNDLMDLAGQ